MLDELANVIVLEVMLGDKIVAIVEQAGHHMYYIVIVIYFVRVLYREVEQRKRRKAIIAK
jgi:hypothetical protein